MRRPLSCGQWGATKGFKQGSYEIKLRFESVQSDSQEGTVWKRRAGRRLLQVARQEVMVAEAVKMERRRQSEFRSLWE